MSKSSFMHQRFLVVIFQLVIFCALSDKVVDNCIVDSELADREAELHDVLLLQVDHNLTPVEESLASHPPASAAVHKRPAATKPISLLASYDQRLQSLSGAGVSIGLGWFVLGIFALLMVGTFIGLAVLSLSKKESDPKRDPTSGSERLLYSGDSTSRQGPAGAYSRPSSSSPATVAVPPPILCKELILKGTEARFQLDMSSIMDPECSPFSVMSPSGKKLLEAITAEGRMLSIVSPGQDTPRVMVRASSASSQTMLSILDATGAYFGKVAAGPTGKGLVLYHMNRPSVIIKVNNIQHLDIQAVPILNYRGGASLSTSGGILLLRVKPGVDAVLYLACFLGMILLEPNLLEQGLDSSMDTIMPSQY